MTASGSSIMEIRDLKNLADEELLEAVRRVEAGFDALSPGDDASFRHMAAVATDYQRRFNPVYGRYGGTYLPVEAFKMGPVAAFQADEAERMFESSRTGRSTPSRHFVRKLSVYERAVTTHFEAEFGCGPFTFVAHLPHYAERGSRSSLLYMVELLVRRYGDDHSGFFLQDRTLLRRAIDHSRSAGTPFLLFGAAFGLLDLIEDEPVSLPEGSRVVETGGMKTYRRAIERNKLHRRLSDGLHIPVSQVWSEYGMCEMLSQCYARAGGVFLPPPWLRFEVVDPEQPDRPLPEGQSGALALFDLANLYSVSGLLTEDEAVRCGRGFEVLGRLSRAALRGCNFLLE